MFGHLTLLAGLLAAPVSGAPVPVAVEVHARALAPGEPLRIVVTSPEPLESLVGQLLEESVFLMRTGPSGAGERWSGWAMIALDQSPQMASIDIHGRTRNGRQVVGTHLVTVRPKEFPEEQLSVAPRYVEPPPDVEKRLVEERAALAAIYRTRREWTPDEAPFVRPVPGGPTSAFGTRRVYNGQPRSPHPGLDLRASTGTEVRSSGQGRVVLARDLYYSGNTVIVDHGGGLFTLYAHLSRIVVDEQSDVAASQIIGLSGATGRVTGPHLHWGAKIGSRPFDPTALLERSVFGPR